MSDPSSWQVEDPPRRPPQFSLKWLFALPVIVAVYFAIARAVGLGPAALLMLLGAAFAGLFVRPTRAVSATVLLVFLFAMMMLPATGSSRPSSRAQCNWNLSLIAQALTVYQNTYGCFPPAYIADEKGRPMHSWRVLILPYLDCQGIYDSYHFDEPWDGPHNSALLPLMPNIYRCPCSPRNSTTTSYAAIVGPHTAWPGSRGRKLTEITDGLPQTLLVVETTADIPWMAPRDLEADKLPLAINPPSGTGISAEHPQTSRFPPREPTGANVAFANGMVMFLTNDLPAEVIKALITADGGEKVDLDRALNR
jgi:hypothetical protein